MKNSKSSLRQVITEIRFDPIFKFNKDRIDLCEKFLKDLPHWNLDMSTVSMYDHINLEDSRKIFTIMNHRASFDYKNCVYFNKFKLLVSSLLKEVVGHLEINILSRHGIRFFYLHKIKSNFAEFFDKVLVKLFNEKFFSGLNVNNDIEDFVYKINFKKDDILFTLNLSHIRTTRGDIVKVEDLGKFMLIDLDCFVQNISSKQIENFISTSYKASQDLLGKITRYIGG